MAYRYLVRWDWLDGTKDTNRYLRATDQGGLWVPRAQATRYATRAEAAAEAHTRTPDPDAIVRVVRVKGESS